MSPTLSLRRRRPIEDEDFVGQELDDADALDLPPIADGAHQTTTHLAARLATVVLLLCLVASPVALAVAGLAYFQSSSVSTSAPPAVVDRSNDQAVASEFAQRVVVTWLTATQQNPDALVALVKDAQLSTLPRDPFEVRDPSLARITQTNGTWSVTVAVTVTDARTVTARRFFQVAVRLDAGSVSALTLPTPVSPPAVAPASTDDYRSQLDSTGPAAQTVAQFLTAYLTGSGDVGRYLTPGVSLAALSPAPYTSVRLEDLRGDNDVRSTDTVPDGRRLRVLATATAAVTDQQRSTVSYALTLTARAGRWEITGIDPAPAYTPRTSATTAPGTPPPSTRTTTSPPSTTNPATGASSASETS